MCACLSKNFGLSSSLKKRMEGEESMISKKQGIISILGSDSDGSSPAASLRRTLSADMSSKKWLSENGFLPPMKKVASSGEFPISETSSFSSTNSSSSEDEDEDEEEDESRTRFDLWASIQVEKNQNKSKDSEKGGPFCIWSSIMSQKPQGESASKPLPPPYVHPLVKRSKSTLSGKSLEICTESLGSESGSDEFSSYSQSKTGDGEEEKEQSVGVHEQQEPMKQELRGHRQEEPIRTVKFGSLADKKLSQRSFPPPLSSFARQDGASTYMRTRRDNGRLVLEAVAVPSKNNFCAQRQDGRLVLTFAKANQDEEMDQERWEETEQEKDMEEEEEFEGSEEEIEMEGNNEETQEDEMEDEEEEEMGFVMEEVSKVSRSPFSVHRLVLMVKKPINLANKNHNEITELQDQKAKEEENEGKNTMTLEKLKPEASLVQSLTPRSPTAKQILSSPLPLPLTVATTTATSFNAYEPYWRLKTLTENEQQRDVVLWKNRQQGGGAELVVKACKDQRKSILLWGWEPYPIAT